MWHNIVWFFMFDMDTEKKRTRGQSNLTKDRIDAAVRYCVKLLWQLVLFYARLAEWSNHSLELLYAYHYDLPCGHIGATWRMRLSSCFLRPTRVHNPNPSAISAQLMAESLYTLQWAVPFPKNCPFPWGSGTPSNTWFVGPIRANNPKGISIVSAVFVQMTAECPCTLQCDAPSPQNCPFPLGDLDPI